jgi:hypothetical protein
LAGSRIGQLIAGRCGCPPEQTTCGCVTVDSSIPSVLLGLLGPPIMIGLSALWLLSGAPWWIGGIGVVGVVALVVVLFDMPVLSVFSEQGVTRRAPLRDQHFAWPDIQLVALTRAAIRPGLVAQVSGRSYLLADRVLLDTDHLEMLTRMRPTT